MVPIHSVFAGYFPRCLFLYVSGLVVMEHLLIFWFGLKFKNWLRMESKSFLGSNLVIHVVSILKNVWYCFCAVFSGSTVVFHAEILIVFCCLN